ncbi:MAG: energy transducer TonB [Desulfocapsa sp.]|nr:energy transducer TonB [Desulfocapsa sp.]
MQRLLPALFFALCCHGLLLLLPYSEKNTPPPLLPGKKTIRISLSGDVTTISETKRPDSEEEKHTQNPEPLPEKKQPEIAIPKEPVLQQEKSVVPVALQAQSVKKLFHPKPVATQPPINLTPKKSPQPVSHEIVQATPPVTVKAVPLYEKNPKPDYPLLARRRNWQGTVILSVTVSEQGSVNQITLYQSSGHELLDKTALKTVKTWHFIPGRKNDRPTVMEVLVPVHFKLD